MCYMDVQNPCGVCYRMVLTSVVCSTGRYSTSVVCASWRYIFLWIVLHGGIFSFGLCYMDVQQLCGICYMEEQYLCGVSYMDVQYIYCVCYKVLQYISGV